MRTGANHIKQLHIQPLLRFLFKPVMYHFMQYDVFHSACHSTGWRFYVVIQYWLDREKIWGIELVALLNLSSLCLVVVERLFLAVPRGCLRFVIVVFPDHTHLLFLRGLA